MESKSVIRRRHGRDLKADVLAACNEPGASVAAIAMAHGLNANLVHKWRRNAAHSVVVPPSALTMSEFVAVPLTTAPISATPSDIHIQLRRGPTTVTVNWPMAGAGACAVWLREWLR